MFVGKSEHFPSTHQVTSPAKTPYTQLPCSVIGFDVFERYICLAWYRSSFLPCGALKQTSAPFWIVNLENISSRTVLSLSLFENVVLEGDVRSQAPVFSSLVPLIMGPLLRGASPICPACCGGNKKLVLKSLWGQRLIQRQPSAIQSGRNIYFCFQVLITWLKFGWPFLFSKFYGLNFNDTFIKMKIKNSFEIACQL